MTWPQWAKADQKGLSAYAVESTAARLRLEQPTADLLAQGDLAGIVRGLYDALAGEDIRWSPDLYTPDEAIQAVRPPEDILEWAGDGTCLDLALLMAGAALGKGLLPIVVVLNGHALVAIATHLLRTDADKGARVKREGAVVFADGVLTGDGAVDRLRDLVARGEYVMVECTGFAKSEHALSALAPEGQGRVDGLMTFERATAAGLEQLDFAPRGFEFAIDVAYLRDVARIAVHETEAAGLERVNTNLRRRQERLLADYSLVAGRDADLAALDEFVATPQGYCLVTGPPGTGKTALMAEWVRRLRDRRDLRIISFFISRPDGTAASQADFLQSLIGQGAWAWGRRIDVSGGVLALESNWLELLDPARPPAKPVVVVIDGVDECDGWELRKSALPAELPAGVHIVLSARGEQADWQDELGLRAPTELVLAAFQEPAVRAILQAAGAPAWLLEDKAFQVLYDRVQGDPFYVRLVCDEVLSGGIRDIRDLAKVEKSLERYLATWWKDMGKTAGDAPVTALVSYLAVALAPMTRTELTEVSAGDALNWANFPAAYDAVRRYVRGDPDGAGIAFGHWRLRDYISKTALSDEARAEATKTIIEWCERWAEHYSHYALTRTISHYLREAEAPGGRAAAMLQASLELIRNPDFQQARVDKAGDGSGLVADFNQLTALLAAADPTDADALLTMSLEYADARQNWLQPAAVFELAEAGHWEEAASRLDLLPASAMWRSVAQLSIAWLAADAEGTAVRPLLDLDHGRTPVLTELADRVQRWVSGDRMPPPEAAPAGAGPGGLDEAAAVMTRLSSGEAYRGADGADQYGRTTGAAFVGVEAEAPVLVAAAGQYPGPGDDLLEQYIEVQGANPYADYRNRTMAVLLAQVLGLPDAAQARRHAVQIAQCALNPSPVQFCDYLYLSVQRRKEEKDGDPRPTLAAMAGRLEAEAREISRSAPVATPYPGPPGEGPGPYLHGHPLGYNANAGAGERTDPGRNDLWSFLRRRIAMTAETLALVDDRPTAVRLLDEAMLFVQGFAGYRAPAFLTLAEANLIARPDGPAARRECVERAMVAAHNIQDPAFCARTTAMVNAVAARLDSAYDIATEVERFASSPSTRAISYGSVHRVGEGFGYREQGTHVPVDVVTRADTLESLARDVFSLPTAALAASNPDLERSAQLPVGAAVVLPDPAFVPILAAWLSADVLASALPAADKTRLIARLVPFALGNLTALDTVLARLVAVAPTFEDEDRDVLKKTRTYETLATTVYAETNERARYGVS